MAPQISVPGPTLQTGGLGALPTFLYHWNSFQLYDDAFLTHGAHSLTFGFALERMQNNTTANLQPTGFYGSGSLSGFSDQSAFKSRGDYPRFAQQARDSPDTWGRLRAR